MDGAARYVRVVDNATHSMFGLLIAEGVIRARNMRYPNDPAKNSTIRWVSVLANNLPDLDATYASRFGGKLGYLLHHRGHTHTLLAAPLLALLLFGVWLCVRAWRGRSISRSDGWTLLGVAVAGTTVHIALDALNNYGVHPLWPGDPRWIYGDSLFIVEPWLYVVLVPVLVPSVPSRFAQGVLWFVLGAGLALGWSLTLVPWGVALALTLGAVASVWFARKVGPGARFRWGVGGTLGVITLFALGSRLAEAQTRAWALPATVPTTRLLDVVVTPSPGNPLCFGIITVAAQGDSYVARAGSLSLLPSVISPGGCNVQPTGLTIGLNASTERQRDALQWEGEWRGSIAELQRLAQSHCQVEAWTRFARVPFWRREPEGRELLGDLRFDRDPDLDFDEFVAEGPGDACPTWVPGWAPPRRDLLDSER